MRTNRSQRRAAYPEWDGRTTHEGAPAAMITPEQELRRSLCACLMGEDTFYEQGIPLRERILSIVPMVDASKVAQMAIECRSAHNLRHAPLWIVREMARTSTHKHLVADTLEAVIQRADEPAEFLAIYWADGRQPVSAQVKKGLARALKKFDQYALAKYDRDGAIKLRDVLFISHPKPKDGDDYDVTVRTYCDGNTGRVKRHKDGQGRLWQQLKDGTIETPDTWEVNLSGGGDKKATFERMISENKLGAMAMIRNLRNMTQAGVDDNLIRIGLGQVDYSRVFPFRFIAAARYAPRFEPELEKALFSCCENSEKLHGRTIILVDVSGSMNGTMSDRSEMLRLDAAYGVAMIAMEICESASVYTFSNDVLEIAPRRGFALRDACDISQSHSGTRLGMAVERAKTQNPDRIICITDEQSHDPVGEPDCRGYMINVAAYQNGVGYGPWSHIDGFSDAVIKWILEYEKLA